MPFIPHTPESLLARSDSRNPATTCNGITSAGRPCRRALATTPRSSPSPRPSPSAISRVLSVVPADLNGLGSVEAAVFFCWQHKDQAERFAASDNPRGAGRKKEVVEMRERTSVDTLIERLGLLEVGDGSPTKAKGSRRHRVHRKEHGLDTRRSGLGSSTTAIECDPRIAPDKLAVSAPRTRRKDRGDGNLIVSLFCCVRSVDGEDMSPPPRPRVQSHASHARRAEHPDKEGTTSAWKPNGPVRAPREKKPVSMEAEQGRASQQPTRPAPTRIRLSNQTPSPLTQPQPRPHDPPSQTTALLLSLIPQSLPPHTTSALLTELAKPLPSYDSDSGYIYIFWLTATTSSTPPPSPQTAASLLLLPPIQHHPPRPDPPGKTPPLLLLKIGRASNVHRRLNEWSRQCGYALSLVRYYPYLPSSPSTSPLTSAHASPAPRTPRKVPHVARVERLIHLELAARRVKRACVVCGREHREWFEVEGSVRGLRAVDEVVGRWVRWGEGVG